MKDILYSKRSRPRLSHHHLLSPLSTWGLSSFSSFLGEMGLNVFGIGPSLLTLTGIKFHILPKLAVGVAVYPTAMIWTTSHFDRIHVMVMSRNPGHSLAWRCRRRCWTSWRSLFLLELYWQRRSSIIISPEAGFNNRFDLWLDELSKDCVEGMVVTLGCGVGLRRVSDQGGDDADELFVCKVLVSLGVLHFGLGIHGSIVSYHPTF